MKIHPLLYVTSGSEQRAAVKKFLKEEPLCVTTPKGHRFTLIKRFCKGCRICVDFCPTGTLDLDDRFKITIAHPEKCIGCRMCEMRCPDMAIYVKKSERAPEPVVSE
jgi:2-oxoglutarate ferredoxin oxidoreductase subunit delta